MKFVWEADDVVTPRDGSVAQRSGRLIRSGDNSLWVLGYLIDRDSETPSGHPLALISLDDGMIVVLGTVAEAVDHLNKGINIPAELWKVPIARGVDGVRR